MGWVWAYPTHTLPMVIPICWMRISILFDSACFPKSVVLFSWFQLRISALVCFKFRLSVCFSKGKVVSSRFVRKIVPFVSIPLFNSNADYQQNKNLRISAQIHVYVQPGMCNSFYPFLKGRLYITSLLAMKFKIAI